MIGWWFAAALAAETPVAPTVTLDAVLASVDAHLPLLVAARAEVDAAEGMRMAALGGFDPQGTLGGWWRTGPYEQGYVGGEVRQGTPLYGLEVAAGYRVGLGEYPAYEGWFDTLDRGEIYGTARLPLLKGGLTDEVRTEIAVATAKLDGAEAKLAAKRVELGLKARSVWWKWVAAGAKVAVAEDMLAVALTSETAVDTRVDRGDAAPIDAVDVRRVVVERQVKAIELRRDAAAAAYALGLYLRGPTGQPSPPLDAAYPPLPGPAALTLEPVEALVARAMQGRPEVRAVEAAWRAADAKVRLGRMAVLPKLDLKLKVAQDLGTDDEKTEPVDVTLGADLGFTFLQRPGRGKLAEAQADRVVVEADRDWLRQVIDAEVRTAHAVLKAAFEGARLAEEAVRLAKQLEDATRRRYELGDADLFRVYLREQSTMKARMDAVDAWTQFHLAEAALVAALGEP